jgi:hypothetical protein
MNEAFRTYLIACKQATEVYRETINKAWQIYEKTIKGQTIVNNSDRTFSGKKDPEKA